MLRYQKASGGVTILMREGVAADTQEGGKESMWNLGALLGVLDPSCPTVGKLEQYWPERAIVTRGLTVLQAEGTGLYHQVNRRDQQTGSAAQEEFKTVSGAGEVTWISCGSETSSSQRGCSFSVASLSSASGREVHWDLGGVTPHTYMVEWIHGVQEEVWGIFRCMCVPSRHNLTFHCEDHSQLTALASVDLESVAETGLNPCSSLAAHSW